MNHEIDIPFTVGDNKDNTTEKLLRKALLHRQSQIFGFDKQDQNYGQISKSKFLKVKPQHGSFVQFRGDSMTDSWGKPLDPRAYSRQINTDIKYHETERPVYGL